VTSAATNVASRAAGSSPPFTRTVGETWAPSAFLRAVNAVRAELVPLLGPLLLHLRTRGWRALPATAILLLMMLLFNLAPTGGMMGSLMRSVSAASADLPWWQAALRLPASMFAPASNLPIWGAFAQVAVIAAAAESLLGWPRMLLVGILANAAATAGARHGLAGTAHPTGNQPRCREAARHRGRSVAAQQRPLTWTAPSSGPRAVGEKMSTCDCLFAAQRPRTHELFIDAPVAASSDAGWVGRGPPR